MRRAESRFGKPRTSQKGTVLFFSLVRKEPKVPQRFANLWTPGERFKALSEKILAEFSNGTSRTRFFAQNGGEKALNRCDAPALQRKELERTAKEEPSSLRTVGYGWVRICGVSCGNWRRLRTVKQLVRIGGVLVAKKTCFFSSCKTNR